jgi:hypothetical protein
MRDRSDWRLNPRLFQELSLLWGPFSVDLFATRANAQLPRYFAHTWDPGAAAIDALAQDWEQETPYGNPPFIIMSRVLQKVAQTKTPVTLIVPAWRTAVWWPAMLRLLVAVPRVLPRATDTFLPGHLGSETALGLPPWDSLAVRLSGSRKLQLAFRLQLLSLEARPGAKAPLRQAMKSGDALSVFAARLESIPWQPLLP